MDFLEYGKRFGTIAEPPAKFLLAWAVAAAPEKRWSVTRKSPFKPGTKLPLAAAFGFSDYQSIGVYCAHDRAEDGGELFHDDHRLLRLERAGMTCWAYMTASDLAEFSGSGEDGPDIAGAFDYASWIGRFHDALDELKASGEVIERDGHLFMASDEAKIEIEQLMERATAQMKDDAKGTTQQQ